MYKYPEFFFGKYCLKSKYQNMGKIFENYSGRNSSLKTKQKIKLFTEVYSELHKTSKKELLAKIVINFSCFLQKRLS